MRKATEKLESSELYRKIASRREFVGGFWVFWGITSAGRLSTGVPPAASFRREASTPVGNLG